MTARRALAIFTVATAVVAKVPAPQRLDRDYRHRSGHTGGRYGSHVEAADSFGAYGAARSERAVLLPASVVVRKAQDHARPFHHQF